MKLLRFFVVLLFCGCLWAGESQALKDAYKDYFYIGAAIDKLYLSNPDCPEIKIVRNEFNSISPENLLKWSSYNPQEGKYNYEPSDQYIAFGVENNMFIVGHVLFWHTQVPEWIFKDSDGNQASRELLLARMRDRVRGLVSRYGNKIAGWDVVNEAILEDGSLRDTRFRQIIGDDWIIEAYKIASEELPASVELYYNDYDTFKEKKRARIVQLADEIRNAGARLSGLGIQCHWGLDWPSLDQAEQTIKAFAATGLDVHITEIDMGVLPWPYKMKDGDNINDFPEFQDEFNMYRNGLPESVEQAQAKRYAQLFSLFLKYKDSVKRVTFWGVQDGHSCHNYLPVRNRVNYPLLFDRQLHKKKAYDAIINCGENARK